MLELILGWFTAGFLIIAALFLVLFLFFMFITLVVYALDVINIKLILGTVAFIAVCTLIGFMVLGFPPQ